jgi:hypothetical protein
MSPERFHDSRAIHCTSKSGSCRGAPEELALCRGVVFYDITAFTRIPPGPAIGASSPRRLISETPIQSPETVSVWAGFEG